MLTQTKKLALYAITAPLAITGFAVFHAGMAVAKAYSYMQDMIRSTSTIDNTPDVFIHTQYQRVPEYFDRPLSRQDLEERTSPSRFNLDSIEF